jgi:hypothetical protein
VSNTVIAKVGANGKVSLLNANGTVQYIVDVFGWYGDGTGPAIDGGQYTALAPARLADTRRGTGGVSGPVGPGQSVDVQVTGVGGVPATGVSAVVLNVTATQPTAASWLVSYPAGTSPANTASMSYAAGQTVSNTVIAKVGANGKVSLLNANGTVQYIVDVFGWYTS